MTTPNSLSLVEALERLLAVVDPEDSAQVHAPHADWARLLLDVRDAMAIVKAQKPVAWRIRLKAIDDGAPYVWSYHARDLDPSDRSAWEIEPLYATPQPAPSAFDPEPTADMVVAFDGAQDLRRGKVPNIKAGLRAALAVAPRHDAFDPEAVAEAIRKQVESWKGSHSQSNQMVALRDTANAIADCLPADEREGWLRKAGVQS